MMSRRINTKAGYISIICAVKALTSKKNGGHHINSSHQLKKAINSSAKLGPRRSLVVDIVV